MSTPGAPPPPPSLAKAVHKGDEGKVTKVLTKLTTGGGKKGRKQQKKGGKNKGGTPTDFNAPVAKWDDGEKAPLLADAAINGHLGVLELLLRIENIKVNRASEPSCATPLSVAAEKDHVACVARLLAEAGIEVNQPNTNGVTPLFIACLLYTSPSPRD